MKSYRKILTSIVLAGGLAGVAAACHHDKQTPASAGTATGGSNTPANVGGASMENSATGGPSGSAPGDSYRNTGTDPATGMSTDGGVGGDTAPHR